MTLPTSSTRQRPQLDLACQYLEVNFDNLVEELGSRLAADSPAGPGQHDAARHLRLVVRGLRAERDADGDIDSAIAMVDGIGELSYPEKDLLRARIRAVAERIVPDPPAPPAPSAPQNGRGPAVERPRAAPITEKAGPAAAGVGSVLQALATRALALLNADICQVYLDDVDGLTLQAEAPGQGRSPGPGRLSPDEGFAALVRSNGDALSLEALDLLDLLQGDERTWLDRGVQTLAACPVGAAGEPGSGLLVVARVTPRPFTLADTMEIAHLADEVTLAIASADLLGRAEELAVLKERMKLAREIHDGLASDLSAAVQMFKYHQHGRNGDSHDAERVLLQMGELVEGALQSARDILSTLRPRQQPPRRLAESIKQQLEAFSKTYAVAGVAEILGDDSLLVAEEREAIYQVVREALTNVRKHATCSAVHVTLDTRSRPFVLTVEDDGVGIEPGAVEEKSGSFGILGMRERAQLLGGNVRIGNGPMGGVRLVFHGPKVPIGS